MKPKTVDLARGKWSGILHELGIDRAYLVNRLGPCPLCGGKDRFRFDDKGGNGTYFCNGCGAGKGMKLAMAWTGLPFAECAARIDALCGSVTAEISHNETDEARAARTIKRLRKIGSELKLVGDLDPVGRYLRRRGIKRLPKEFLRYHPSLAYYDGGYQGDYPAMVAAFRQPTGEIESFHATYLTQEGHKARVRSGKKALGAIKGLSGCAVRLSDVQPHIGIAEGIETALSVTELYGLPCWSCYSANGIETFQPPEGVERVTIYPDSDANYTGQAAAFACARRLTLAGYEADVAELPAVGTDFNDILMEAAACRA